MRLRGAARPQSVNRSVWGPVPVWWRLFLPGRRVADAGCRVPGRVVSEVTWRGEWRLALGMLGTLAGRGVSRPRPWLTPSTSPAPACGPAWPGGESTMWRLFART
ncbi:hypothetical protein GCM10015536_30830 [Streptomyces griseomycini]|nr:hypothetical protein GCM10015536_30830 [Streptomyces griseomycini]